MPDENRTSHFSTLTEEDLRPWREQPISKLLIEFLREQCEKSLDHIADCIDEDKVTEAKITRGGLLVCKDLILRLEHPPERPRVEVEDEAFVDPAALRGKVTDE